jgi:hypothetical protein
MHQKNACLRLGLKFGLGYLEMRIPSGILRAGHHALDRYQVGTARDHLTPASWT